MSNTVVQFSRKNEGQPRYDRSCNSILTYVMLTEGASPSAIAERLKVSLRTAYRYIRIAKRAADILSS